MNPTVVIALQILFAVVIYLGVAWWTDELQITIENGVVRTRYRPLPVPAGGQLETAAIASLFIRERSHQTYFEDSSATHVSEWYAVVARGKSGHDVVLVDDIQTPLAAAGVLHTLAAAPGMEHVAVDGQAHTPGG
jgi:hypothetical protein